MKNLSEITDEIRQYFYHIDPGKIYVDKINEIIDCINKIDKSQVTEGMKVYCTECEWYQDGFCKNEENLYEEDSWASRIKMKRKPWEINKLNDCKWFSRFLPDCYKPPREGVR